MDSSGLCTRQPGLKTRNDYVSNLLIEFPLWSHLKSHSAKNASTLQNYEIYRCKKTRRAFSHLRIIIIDMFELQRSGDRKQRDCFKCGHSVKQSCCMIKVLRKILFYFCSFIIVDKNSIIIKEQK